MSLSSGNSDPSESRRWRSLRSRLFTWLCKRGENQRRNLTLLLTGAGLLFSGGAIIIWADSYLPSSVEQELIALFGTLLAIAGIATALFGYLGLSLLRLFRFFQDK